MAVGSAYQASFLGCYYSNDLNCLLGPTGERLPLRRKSLAVFRYLSEHPGKVISKDELFDQIWAGVVVTDDALGKCIADIRKAIGDTDKVCLQTTAGVGYALHADSVSISSGGQRANPESRPRYIAYGAVAIVMLALGSMLILANKSADLELDKRVIDTESPTISVEVASDKPVSPFMTTVQTDTRIALARYRSIALVDSSASDFTVRLAEREVDGNQGVSVELIEIDKQQVLFADTLPLLEPAEPSSVTLGSEWPPDDASRLLGYRIAGMIASPGGGAISRYLLESARYKPVEALSRAECYAYGYGCTSCSGELDTISERAERCLDRILSEDPENPRAWGLQSTVFARQYLWASGLREPERTSLAARSHLAGLALQAAQKAEKYSDGGDSSVYWGMAQAYSATCDSAKLQTAVERGLAINPGDPSLLGSYGNWIAYTGQWDDGIGLIKRALEIEPRHYKRWWLFATAKKFYAEGNYAQALIEFRRAYNERNWLSHLQLAYTLPYLGRMDEAISSRRELERLYPGVTIEHVVQFYASYCFDDAYIEKIKWALIEAGLPNSAGQNSDRPVAPPRAKLASVNGVDLEYMDLGSGVPIVFVHGSISDYRAWSYLQNPISQKHRFVSYSLRYYGSQEWKDAGEKFGLNTDAEDLIALIEFLDAGPVFVVGWSRGSAVSAIAASRRPDLFRGMLQYEPIVDGLANSNSEVILSARDAFNARFVDSERAFDAGQPEQATALILENVFELDRGRFAFELMPVRGMNKDAIRVASLEREKSSNDQHPLTCEYLNALTIPTLVLAGGNTNAWWAHLVKRFHDCVPGSEYVVLSDVNHDGPVRQPSRLAALIVDFVDRNQ